MSLVYMQLVNARSYDALIYFQVLLVNIALNQTWIALLIAIVCTFPTVGLHLALVISGLAGFTCGFFIPVGVLHWG